MVDAALLFFPLIPTYKFVFSIKKIHLFLLWKKKYIYILFSIFVSLTFIPLIPSYKWMVEQQRLMLSFVVLTYILMILGIRSVYTLIHDLSELVFTEMHELCMEVNAWMMHGSQCMKDGSCFIFVPVMPLILGLRCIWRPVHIKLFSSNLSVNTAWRTS